MNGRVARFIPWLCDPRHGKAQPFFLPSLAACGGIWIAEALPLWSPWIWLGIVVTAGVLFWKWPGRPALLLSTAAVFAFAHHTQNRDPLREELDRHVRPGGGMPATLTGIITDAPAPGTTGNGFSFPLKIERLETPLPRIPAEGAQLYVRVRDFPPTLRYGDRITLTGLLRRPQSPRNPGEFDFPDFLKRQGFSAEFDASAARDHLTLESRDAGWPVMAAALRSRDWIGEAVTKDITDDPELAATVRAMVLGTREKTPAEVEEAFIASGTMHVFAVSGLHVVLFFGIMVTVLRMVRLSPAWILWIALPVMFFYVYITGLRPSAWRAAIMAATVFSAPLFNRESNLFNHLGLAALLLLTCDTQQLFQPGFTLSFGVLLALAILHPLAVKLMRPLREHDPFLPRQLCSSWRLWLRRFVADSISVSIACTVGSALLMIHYFRLFTPIGIVSNLFLVALSEGILIVACASLATAALGLTVISTLFNHCNWLLALCSVRTAQFFAAVPGGHFQVDPSRMFRGDLCEVTVLSVESGAAVHLDTPDGRHWLIDSGGRRHFTRTVRPHLLRTPVNRLDGLLISHTDAQHSGAAGEVRRVFQPIEQPVLTAGQEISPAPGIRLRCLFPPEGWKSGTADDRCAVFMLECRGTRILLTNDAGFITEKALLTSGEDLRADILIKGQNGNDYSGLPEFINAVHPQAVIFTNNQFPAGESVTEEWTNMLRQKNIHFFDQSQTGAVTIRIEPGGTTMRAFCGGAEFPLRAGD